MEPRLEGRFDPEAVRQMKASEGRDLLIGGADLAAQALTAGLVDEFHVFLAPVAVGGGKSALMIGAAAREHRSALILRREAVQLYGLWSFALEVCGAWGWSRNKVEKAFTSPDGRVLKFAGLNEPDDWRKYAGIARDFYGFDEAAEFLEEQVASLIGWLRSTIPGQAS